MYGCQVGTMCPILNSQTGPPVSYSFRGMARRRGPLPKLPFSAWFTRAGWRERWQRLIGNAKNIYTISKCKKNIKGFTLPRFKGASAHSICLSRAGVRMNSARTPLRLRSLRLQRVEWGTACLGAAFHAQDLSQGTGVIAHGCEWWTVPIVLGHLSLSCAGSFVSMPSVPPSPGHVCLP
jgi:hypothetical protein